MKRTYTIILAILLVIALAVPAFASESHSLSGQYQFNHMVMSLPGDIKDTGWTDYYVNFTYTGNYGSDSGIGFQMNKDGNVVVLKSGGTGAWLYSSSIQGGAVHDGIIDFGSTPQSVSEEFYFWVTTNAVPIATECDGSSCDATDINSDNICDNCGKPLAMSLRSTEYDYAVSLAEGKNGDGYPYWAIFQSGERYVIHVSKNPMTTSDGETLEAEGMMYTKTTNTNGTFSLTGWYNGYYSSTDSFVYANHTIENFPPVPPFLEQMGEPIRALGVEVTQTMAILVTVGVGCLALLILLAILARKSQIFHL